jgi:hypothetical protein
MSDTKRKKTSRRKLTPGTTIKRRSAAAAALRDPLFRKRVVKPVKTYSRKRKTLVPEDESE